MYGEDGKAKVGAAMPNGPRNKSLPISMKFGDIVRFAFINRNPASG
jgi:hypothetical protein